MKHKERFDNIGIQPPKGVGEKKRKISLKNINSRLKSSIL